MSEEIKKLNVFEAFAQSQQTFAEAEEKARREAGAPRVERFRTNEDGEYSIRILPLAPTFDENGNVLPMDRKGYEYPLHQFFLAIDVPGKKGGKAKTINIPVVNARDKGVGHSVDLIDTYVKICKEMYGDDDDVMKLIDQSSYYKGLRYNYQHAIMVLDLSSEKERAKGPQIWQCSHSQYKDIDEAKMRLWRENLEEDENAGCPISGIPKAYPLKVIRKTEKTRTSYTIEIGRKEVAVKEEEVEKLLDLPRLPELLYRYTRYQFEATLEFLKQYDLKHGLEVCLEPDFQEAVAQLEGELSPDDTSHFDLADAGKQKESDKVTIDSLWDECNYIADNDLGEKSQEYQELREKIRQFIEDNNLDLRLSRLKNNQQMLEEIEEALEDAKTKGTKPAKKEEEEAEDDPKPAPRKKAVKKPVPEPEPEAEEEPEEEPEAPEAEEEAEEEPEPEPAPAPKKRSPRPGTVVKPEKVEEEAEEEPEEEPAPAPVRRPRRLR